MKMFALAVLMSLVGLEGALAGVSVVYSDTTGPKPTRRRPIQLILPGYQLDTSFSTLTKPDPAVYEVVPKWLRAKAAGHPVYVVDGQVAKASQLKGLKASAVASVTVMTGERAMAMYGSVARQGVVAITTKAGLLPAK